MKRLIQRALAAAGVALLAAWSCGASAELITARFDGTVSGYEPGFLDLNAVAYDNDNPIGTAVHWDMTFDNSFTSLSLNDFLNQGYPSMSGSLQVGANSWSLTGFQQFSLSYNGFTGAITGYRPQVVGTGPGSSDGASFFGMFLTFAPDLSLLYPGLIGFDYASEFAHTYGYLETIGTYSFGSATNVPEPATALLLLPAALLLMRKRRAAGPVREAAA